MMRDEGAGYTVTAGGFTKSPDVAFLEKGNKTLRVLLVDQPLWRTIMPIVFIIGTAGSGKSLLSAAFSEWLRTSNQHVAIVNLDPGVLTLPYVPDFDVRDYVSLENLMKEYGLGPNGALVMASDLIADQAEVLSSELDELNADVVLVDTPGQIELFAFRVSGPYLAKELTKDEKAIVYMHDSVFSCDPLNYVSNLFLSTAVYNRFLLPQTNVLSKCDLLPKEKIDEIVNWSFDPNKLEAIINEKLEGVKRLLSRDLLAAIYDLGLHFPLTPVSSKNNDGMTGLNSTLELLLSQGDKYTY